MSARSNAMRYVSTRGQAPELGFDEVLLAGLARDGGLYLPVAWPSFDGAAWRARDGVSIATSATATSAATASAASSLRRTRDYGEVNATGSYADTSTRPVSAPVK